MATITGDGGNNNLPGTDNADVINGLGGDDIINGMGGNDTITGGPGIDTLTGGGGTDTFLDDAAGLNGDTITDFLPGDRIQFTDLDVVTANIAISTDTSSLTYNLPGGGQGSLHIGNLGPGRFVVRAISGGGVDVRLQAAAHNDFNGDGKSDILWRGDDGTMRDWLGQSGGTFVGNKAHFDVNPGSFWHVAGTGDFNGDGRLDILWRGDDGTMRNWLGQPDGSFVGNIAHFNANPGLSWHVVGTGGCNGRG